MKVRNTAYVTVAASVVAMCATAHCATWYVDNKLESYENADGKTWETAFHRIQDAVDKAKSDDTVLVAPGTYGDDQGTVIDNGDSTGKNGNYTYQPNRIWINNKHITLKSSEGAAVTHIVGKHADTETGIGEGAVRCISMSGNGYLPGTRIEGFTIRDGAALPYREGWTVNSAGEKVIVCNAAHRGGGLLFNYTSTETHRKIHVVDCVISNCVAPEGAAAYGVTLLRCRVTGNSAHRAFGGTVMQCNAANCVFDYNGAVTGEGVIGVTQKSYPVSAVNCTFFANKGGLCLAFNDGSQASASASVCNSLFQCTPESSMMLSQGSIDWTGGTFSNCVADCKIAEDRGSGNVYLNTRVKNAQLAAPIFGDFRPVAEPSVPYLFGKGDPDFCSPSWIPEDDRDLDFLRGPRRDDDGSLTIGAIQSSVHKNGGCLTFTLIGPDDTLEVNGKEFLNCNGGYFYGDDPLVQYRVRINPKTPGTEVHSCWLGGYYSMTRFPDVNGEMVVTAPPSSDSQMLCVQGYMASKVVWADAGYTGDDSDGSEEKPYRTLQAAVNATAGLARPLVKVKPGRYGEGGAVLEGYGNCRVVITNSVCLKAVGGPDVTFIEGAGGDDPCRCVGMAVASLDQPAAIVGFTLTGGRTRSGSEAPDTGFMTGGALCSDSETKAQLIGCVISDCAAVQGAAVSRGWLMNCRITGCRNLSGTSGFSSRAVAKHSYLSGCVIGPNAYTTVSVDEGCRVWNCTVNETHDSIRLSINARVYNVLVLNDPSEQNTLRMDNSVAGLVIESTKDLSIGNEYTKVGDAMVASRGEGDVRPLPGSPLLTAGAWEGVPDFFIYTIGGIYGSLLPNGRPVVGAAYDVAVPVTLSESRCVSVSGGLGTAFTSKRHPLTFAATDTSRLFYGFNVNGSLLPDGRELELVPADGVTAYSIDPIYAKRFVITVR